MDGNRETYPKNRILKKAGWFRVGRKESTKKNILALLGGANINNIL